MREWKRRVGDRGQVTIPSDLRERFGIEGGDEVVVREHGDKIVLETPVDRERMAEGYRERAQRDAAIAGELDGTSREANDGLAEAPE